MLFGQITSRRETDFVQLTQSFARVTQTPALFVSSLQQENQSKQKWI
jgi:hypothetical protein